MKEIHIYYSKIKLLARLCLEIFIIYCLLFETHLPNILWSRFSEEGLTSNNTILLLPIFMLILLLVQILFIIKKLFDNKPQISINADRIRHHQTFESMGWESITAFHFRVWGKNPHLELVQHSGYQIMRFQLSYLAYDKARLSDLFTQLIATNDVAEREKWIAHFQAA